MVTTFCGPNFTIVRLVKMAPPISPETMAPNTRPYWVGLKPNWPTNTREEPAMKANIAP
ncbi:hypothetical protein D3C81_1999100 [compost metagenome]